MFSVAKRQMKLLATILALMVVIVIVLSLRASGETVKAENQVGRVTSSGDAISLTADLSRYQKQRAGKGQSLGQISLYTGSIQSGSFIEGGTYGSVGSSFTISEGAKVLFTGAFYGDITVTLVRKLGPALNYSLEGDVRGNLADGTEVEGTVIEYLWGYESEFSQGFGNVGTGTISLSTF